MAADVSVSVVRELRVDASPERVWAVLAHFDAISSWAPNVDHSCLLSDATAGVGMSRRIQTGRTTVVETVTTWEPIAAVGYTISGLPPVIRSITNTWRLRPDGRATTVSLSTEIDAGSRRPQRLVARAVGRKLAQTSDQMLAGLAEHVDQKGSRP